MLPVASRLRRRGDFVGTVCHGRRIAGRSLVVHALLGGPEGAIAAAPRTARVGFVVSSGVGPAVVRNRVRRQLRHEVRARLSQLPAGSDWVVRALPPAAAAGSGQLGRELDVAFARLSRGRPAGARMAITRS